MTRRRQGDNRDRLRNGNPRELGRDSPAYVWVSIYCDGDSAANRHDRYPLVTLSARDASGAGMRAAMFDPDSVTRWTPNMGMYTDPNTGTVHAIPAAAVQRIGAGDRPQPRPAMRGRLQRAGQSDPPHRDRLRLVCPTCGLAHTANMDRLGPQLTAARQRLVELGVFGVPLRVLVGTSG